MATDSLTALLNKRVNSGDSEPKIDLTGIAPSGPFGSLEIAQGNHLRGLVNNTSDNFIGIIKGYMDKIDRTHTMYNQSNAEYLVAYFEDFAQKKIQYASVDFENNFEKLVSMIQKCGVGKKAVTNTVQITKPVVVTPTIKKNTAMFAVCILRLLKVASADRFSGLHDTGDITVEEFFKFTNDRTEKAAYKPTRKIEDNKRLAKESEQNKTTVLGEINSDREEISTAMGGKKLEISPIQTVNRKDSKGVSQAYYVCTVNGEHASKKHELFEYILTKDDKNMWKIASFGLSEYANNNIQGKDRELLLIQVAIIAGKAAKHASTEEVPILFATVDGSNMDDNIIKAFALIHLHLIPVFASVKMASDFKMRLQVLEGKDKNNTIKPEEARILEMARVIKVFKDSVHGDKIYEPKTTESVDRKKIANYAYDALYNYYLPITSDNSYDIKTQESCAILLNHFYEQLPEIQASIDITPQIYETSGATQVATEIDLGTTSTTAARGFKKAHTTNKKKT